MKILTYTSLFPNSVQPLRGHFVFERLRHMSRRVEISVTAPVPYSPGLGWNRAWSEFRRVPRRERFGQFDVTHPRYVVIPKVGMATHGLSMYAGTVRQVSAHLRRHSCDVIDGHYVYPDGVAAVLLGRRFGIPVVLSARGTDINAFSRLITIRPWVRFALRRASALVAVSNSLRRKMLDLGVAPEKVVVAPNGVDPDCFSALERTGSRTAIGLPLDAPIVMSVGRLVELKGFHLLIEAVSRLRVTWPRLLLVIVGEGPERAFLEQRSRESYGGAHVLFAGAQPHSELRKWYSSANLFCLVSSNEGCPNVVLEALSCGIPVMGTRVGGVPEIVDSDKVGLLVERNPEAIAAGIDRALRVHWDQPLILEHARKFDWNGVCLQLEALFERVRQPDIGAPV